MRRVFSPAVFCASLLWLACAVDSGSVARAGFVAKQYTVNTFSFDPNFNLPTDSGTISTDGFLGEITSANVATVVVDWSLTLSIGTDGPVTLTPANSTVTYFDGPNSNLMASATQLAFGPTATPVDPADRLIFGGTAGVAEFIGPDNFTNSASTQLYISELSGGTLPDSTVIATAAVPEASSFLCVFCAAAASWGGRQLRRRAAGASRR